jgi:hypothetical protein
LVEWELEGKQKYPEKTRRSTRFSNTNPAWTNSKSNPDRHWSAGDYPRELWQDPCFGIIIIIIICLMCVPLVMLQI